VHGDAYRANLVESQSIHAQKIRAKYHIHCTQLYIQNHAMQTRTNTPLAPHVSPNTHPSITVLSQSLFPVTLPPPPPYPYPPIPYPLPAVLLPLLTGNPYPAPAPPPNLAPPPFMRSVVYLFKRRGKSTPLKYAIQIAALAPALSRQYSNVLVYMCPPYPLHPGGSVVLGYQRTLNASGSASPIVIFEFRV
jgi:hypothetical protein